MANFDLSWTVSAGTYAQELYLKQKYATGQYNLVDSFDETVNSYDLNGLVDNKIYQYKIKVFCDNGIPKETSPQELVGLTCPQVSALPACNGVINYSFAHLGGDVDGYDVVLYDSTGNTELSRQTKTVSNTVTGSFTTLAPSTVYKVKVEPKADGFTKENCNLVTVITLPAAPTLVTSPSSVARCDDGPYSITTLSASFNGSFLTYSWYRNGVLITDGGNYSGATTTSLTIQNAGSILGSFVCRATNGCGYVESNPAVITLLADTSIVTQPAIIPTCVTDPITLSVTAGGDSLIYQWQKSTDNGSTFSDISGATSSTYTVLVGSITEGDQYRVKVNSTCGPEITSSAAVVDTVVAPTIDTQPSGSTVCPGVSVSFTAAYTAEDATATIWQQLLGGIWYDIGGATSTTYSTTSAGSYRFKVANACGVVYSDVATLTNYSQLAWTAVSSSATLCVGQTATFTNTLSGSSPSYQWAVSTDGGLTYSDLAGETTNTLTLSNVQYSQNGYKYRLTATGPCNTISNVSTLNVYQPVQITSQPTNQSVCNGSPVTFSVMATSGSAITYNWQYNSGSGWLFIGGANSSSYTFNATTAQNGYQYRVTLSSCSSTITSDPVTLTVNSSVAFVVSPTSQSVCVGNNFSFQGVVSGTVTSYQWQVSTDGGASFSNVPGETLNTISGVSTLGQNGYQYRLVVTGPCNTITSTPVTLTVNNTTANWVNRDINTYYVCVGVDKYYQQIDTNPCSATYNQTQTGGLYEANSTACGYVPCNPPTVTSTSMEFIAPCPCPSGYVSSPDLSECVQEVSVSATAPTATTFERTLSAYSDTSYGWYGTVIYTGGFDANTGVPTGATVTDTSNFWRNYDGAYTNGPMNRCAVWTNLVTSNQRIGFSICLNTTQDKTYLVGVGCDNFISIKVNGTTVLTQSPSALSTHYSLSLQATFNIWHVYPIFIPAGNNVIEVSGNNVSSIAAVGVEIYDGTPAQILAAQSYAALGQRLVFSTKDIVGTQVISGTNGVGYTCPDSSYVIKSCGLATPVCYKVLTTTCGST